MDKLHKLVIIGDSAFAQLAYEYFTYDSPYEVVGFSVEQPFIKQDTLFNLPIIPFEGLERHFEPAKHWVYVALVYTQLNRLRARLLAQAKAKGYHAASYVSPHAFIWRNVTFGEHCFVFENNVIQPFCSIGNNVVLWSGNHIGHHSIVRDHVFVASHVVVSGFCDIGEYSFLGVNATVSNNVTVARDNLIGAGAMILKNTQPGLLYGAKPTEASKMVTAKTYFKVPD
jgi:sugar O-acyltransferase (sialic acid O-acetyltransferase NeuD family)